MFITLIFTYNNHLNLYNETIFVCNITYIMPFNKKNKNLFRKYIYANSKGKLEFFYVWPPPLSN